MHIESDDYLMLSSLSLLCTLYIQHYVLSFQFFYVIKGRLLFKIGGQEYRVNQRASVHVPEGVITSMRV